MNVLLLHSGDLRDFCMATPAIKLLKKSGHNVFMFQAKDSDDHKVIDIISDDKASEIFSGVIGFDHKMATDGADMLRWVIDRHIDVVVQLLPGDKKWDWLYEHLRCPIVFAPKEMTDFSVHQSDMNISLLRNSCIPLVEQNDVCYWLPEFESEKVTKIVEGRRGEQPDKRLVLLCPSYKKEVGWDKTHWGNKNFAILAYLLKTIGYKPIIFGDENDIQDCNMIGANIPGLLNLGGCLSAKEQCALIRSVDVVVSGDNWISHVAAAYQKNLLTFFGPTHVTASRPINPKAIGLKTKEECKCMYGGDNWGKCDFSLCQHGCYTITSIRPEAVVKVIEDYVDFKMPIVVG